ncbi:BTAD domain-containing putative transcriptional regulator [Streptomyces nigra]|uniref:AfsR/SARP family transcriptional regulator n=1 Tax=Streptomyces nigra TaxID=1827580 RepID=UPI003454236C
MSKAPIRFTVLGPVRAWQDTDEVYLGSPQQRVVLAVLLLRQSLTVSAADLVTAVWGGAPPRSAVNQLHVYIHRLRRVLGHSARDSEQVIRSIGSGYRVETTTETLDLAAFENTVKAAHALVSSDPVQGRALFEKSLSLWQGSALADLPGSWAGAQRARLEDVRLDVLERSYRLALEAGDLDIAARIAHTVGEHPLDERFRELLMLALYQSGQQAAALDAYTEAREVLARELEIAPGPRLKQLHQRILQADQRLLPHASLTPQAVVGTTAACETPAPPTLKPQAPGQLPYRLPVFSGRQAEVRSLIAAANRARTGRGATVHCISGGAGMGKTTLAVHAAHSLAPHYPDGQLYLDMRGFDAVESPVSPEQALRTVLEAFGVAAHQVPADLDARSALLRSVLAQRRVLLLLDNARDFRHVRSLLPASPGCLVIVTSRNHMVELVANGAEHLRLQALSVTDARDMLARRLGAECVERDPAATDGLIVRSGRLPLALALISATAAARSVDSLADIAAELQSVADALEVLKTAEADIDLRSVFSWSYKVLSPEAARLYRLSSLVPSTGSSVTVLAALSGCSADDVRPALEELLTAHLMDEFAPGRYVSHDLLRAYAAELLSVHESGPQRAEAFRRMLVHCLHTAYRAARVVWTALPELELTAEVLEAPVADVLSGTAALEWFAAEGGLLAQLVCIASAEPGCETLTWQLAWSVMEYLQKEGRWDEQLSTQSAALAAVCRVEDQLGRAHALRGLARSRLQTGDSAGARQLLNGALRDFGELQDLTGQARCHGNLALLSTREGDHYRALPHAHEAVRLFAAAGDRIGQANALNNLGWTLAQTGAYGEALDRCRRALRLLGETDDLVAKAATWDSIGHIQHRLGRHAEASSCYDRALKLDRQLGDKPNEAETLTRLGETLLAMKDRAGAADSWRRALAIYESLDSSAARHVTSLLAGIGETAGETART